MILNLFSYPSNFGKLTMYKCDFFGNALSEKRNILVDKFTVDVDQNPYDEQVFFGGYAMPNYFKLESRKININTDFLFAVNTTGVLDPGVDLLFNLSNWAFKGSTTPLKVLLDSVGSTSLIYNGGLSLTGLQMNINYPVYEFYLVSETTYQKLNVNSVNINTKTITYDNITPISDCWLEIFKYGDESTQESFPVYQEPMFRIDCSEGSFWPCLVDKISFNISDDYTKLSCSIVSINYDRSNRYEFVNSSQQVLANLAIIPQHRSRIIVKDFNNDISTTFAVTDLDKLNYMNGLITQTFENIPIKGLSIDFSNNLEPIYGNIQKRMLRTYVMGYVSKNRKISGTMDILALRSSQPTFDRYPILNSSSSKSLNINFGNQMLKIPYTLWQPGKLNVNQGDYVSLAFNWAAIARQRQGEPSFTLEGEE